MTVMGPRGALRMTPCTSEPRWDSPAIGARGRGG